MHWVYILNCEDGYYYVGETTRLFRRFWEHGEGAGGANTKKYKPESLAAIYKVSTLGKFFSYCESIDSGIRDGEIFDNFNVNAEEKYNHLIMENNIAECLMQNKPDVWEKIRGGTYTQFNKKYTYPNNKSAKEIPLCDCGVPCDIKKAKNNTYLYFRCPKKNMWDGIKKEFNTTPPCKFFMKYMKDQDLSLASNNENTPPTSLIKNKKNNQIILPTITVPVNTEQLDTTSIDPIDILVIPEASVDDINEPVNTVSEDDSNTHSQDIILIANQYSILELERKKLTGEYIILEMKQKKLMEESDILITEKRKVFYEWKMIEIEKRKLENNKYLFSLDKSNFEKDKLASKREIEDELALIELNNKNIVCNKNIIDRERKIQEIGCNELDMERHNYMLQQRIAEMKKAHVDE
jgi:hypothetical protein